MSIETQTAPPGGFSGRPLYIKSLFSRALRVYRQHAPLFWLVEAVVAIPYASWASMAHPPGRGSFSVLLVRLANAFISTLAGSLLLAGGISIVADAALGRPSTLATVRQRVFPALPSIIGLSVVSFVVLVVLLSTIVGIPLAIYLLVAWSFAEPVLLIEQVGIRDALRLSRSLVRGRW